MENDRIIRFEGDHTDYPVISIKKSNLCLIKNLHKHYQQHQNTIKSGGLVPCYKHVSGQAISLVNDALNVRPDRFAGFYHNQLSPHGRNLLIKTSGQYDEKREKVMLDVPEITKRLIDVCFTDDGLRDYVKEYIGKDDEDYVRNYFRERLISSKRLLSLKQPMFSLSIIPEDIYLGSLFIDEAHTIDQYNYPIPLCIENDVHQTYAISFGIDNYEYRITDLHNNQCLLWLINHDNPADTFSTLIKHKKPIKGCRFSKTKTDVEYALTYSDTDMIFSTITTQNGVSFVESKAVDIEGQIVDACFDSVNNCWHVGSYEGLDSVFRLWTVDGEFVKQTSTGSFKAHGLLEKIVIYRTVDQYYLLYLFGVANMYAKYTYKVSDDVYHYEERTHLMSVDLYNNSYFSKIIARQNSVDWIGSRCPFFVDNSTESFLESFWSQPKTEIHRVYSPDGAYLMCNTLKKNSVGILYVETLIQDAVTRKEIFSIDTLYSTFRGVGFTHDGTELIFLVKVGPYYKVSLLNPEDKQMLSEVEDIAFNNLGVISLLKRLCMECRQNGILSLHKNDPIRAMLIDWSKKSPAMLEFLNTCLPMMKTKK